MKELRSYKNMKAWLFGLIGLCLVLTGQTGMAQNEHDNEHNDIKTKIIPYDWVDDKGVLKGGSAEIKLDKDRDVRALDSYPEWPFETIIDNGPIWNRVDLVCVGDGYQESELDDYADDVNNVVNGFFGESPFDEYASYFNVHRVDVNSVDSGVSYDPCDCNCPRNTALSMRFHETVRRLLYIPDANKGAVMYALNRAPDYNVGLALGNTETYGGSGDEPACLAGGNEWRVELGLHEFGHSFGKLGDEYFDPNGVAYPYDESTLEGIGNLSTLYATDMNSQGAKWYRWLDWGPEPKDVWTFKGAFIDYNEGIYRPTDNSKMRSLGRPFEQVNAEQLIFKIYELVKPIDYATLEGTYALGTQFFVQPVKPATHSLDVTWYRVGDPDPVGTGLEFDSSALDLPTGQYTLKVKVIDNTEMVRDEGKRATDMNEVRTWTLGEAGHWKFDEGSGDTAEDSIGDNNGTLGISPYDPAWVNDTDRGWCLDFDGSDYVSLSDMNSLEDSDATIAAWIKADTLAAGSHSILMQYDAPDGYQLYVGGDKPVLYLNNYTAASSDSINTGEWYHLAGTYDGSYLRIYVNGVRKAKTYTAGQVGVSTDAYIGWLFDGKIDDVRVYDWAMDQAQIWEIMSAGASKFCVKDNYRVNKTWFDDSGNLFLKGTLTQSTTPTATANDEFIVKDSSNVIVAIIDTTDGNMYIKGILKLDSEGNWVAPTDGDDNFRIQDSSGNDVAYISKTGDLYLKGKLYQNPE